MRISRDEQGDPVLDPDVLATKLSMSVQTLRRRMRLGLVTSLVEKGEQEHAGLWRITVRCGPHSWRAVLDSEGQVIDETVSGSCP